MDKSWSIHVVAEELMKLFPILGKTVGAHMRSLGDEETTMMQVSVLYQIQHRSITASELAKHRRVSLQSASVLVQGLVEKGWVVRIPSPTDRRQFLLQLTAEGEEKAEATRKQIGGFLEGFLGELSEEEISAAEIFLPALSRILTQHITSENTQDEKQRVPQEEQTPL